LSFGSLFRFVRPSYDPWLLELEGAIRSQQLKRVPYIIRSRRENHETFAVLKKQFALVKTQREIGERSWFGFSLILTAGLSGHRAEMTERLTLREIASRPTLTGNFTKDS
jgi:CDP-6-deoxy-D-xylo-4-hexulose-3-dehydrase